MFFRRQNESVASLLARVLAQALAVTAMMLAVAGNRPAHAEDPDISHRRASERTEFTDDEIKDGFFKIAFNAELQFDAAAGHVRKFDGPVRIFAINNGVPDRRLEIAAIVADIQAHVNHLDLAITASPQLGEPFGIRRCFTKRFALGQFSQTVAQAALEARPFFNSPDDIQEVNIHVSHSAIKIMADGPDKWRPQTHETADHSIPYAAGLMLLYGKIDPAYYEDSYLHDPRLLDLVSRVKCLPSEEADRTENEFNLCELEIVLKSGARKTVRVEYHRGHFKNPMTDAEMEEKFRLMAQKHLSADRVDNLLRLLWAIESVPQVSTLIAATRV